MITDKNKAKKDGFILPVLLFTVTMVMIMITVTTSLALTNYNLAAREVYKVNAQMAADAGLDSAIQQLNANGSWTGSGSEVTLMNSGNIKTTYQTTVIDGSDSTKKTITSVGKTYFPATTSNPVISRKYKVDVQAVTSGNGPSSVVSGVGGLVLNANSKITGGDVVVNGKINIANNAQIGLSTNPVNVRVAHQSCPQPPNSSYPTVCGSGNGQPITMGTNAKIYADVRATNQTTGTNMYSPGLIPNQTVAPIALPTYDRSGQKSAVTTTMTNTAASCGNNGTVTWAANTKIVGTPSIGNGCTVNIMGNVWITGNLALGNNSALVVSNTLTGMPTIMIDGSDGFSFGNNSTVTPNSAGKGVQFITYWSSGGCSPDCSSVTGTDLANSQNVTTINLSNNGSAPNSVLWAAWSQVTISNNGAIGAVTGQTINLGNNAIINFTSSIPGSDNRVTTWVKRGYIRSYN